MRLSLIAMSLIALAACSPEPGKNAQTTTAQAVEQQSQTESFSVLFGGTDVGSMTVKRTGDQLSIDYGFSNNGRGASSQETLALSPSGIPEAWSIKGKTTFGNAVDEQFELSEGVGKWHSAAGEGQADAKNDPLYIAQNASPYAEYIYAKAVLNGGGAPYPALPAGQVTLSEKRTLTLTSANGELPATLYALGGIDMDPSYLLLGNNQQLLGYISPRFAILQKGLESEDTRLRELTATLNAERFEKIAERVTHQFSQPVRINNVRIFDPVSLALSDYGSVLVKDKTIVSVDGVQNEPNGDEVLIDGNGSTLVAGLYEMHGHMSDNDALLNVLAGVTSVRDMGNEADVLESLIDKIDRGELVGPHITKSAFIEGVSKYSNSTGELAATKEEALQLIRDYAARGGYRQIKIYSSMNGAWVPDMAKEAHKLGMRVAGHVPAFYTAEQMIEAGYDEITHINQLMLGWVLGPDEDTRTLFRITGMKRFVDLDLASDKVSHTLDMMVKNNIAIDPTTVIHELAMTSRNGVTRAGAADYIEHMPISVQRRAKVAMLNVADENEDKAYQAAYDKIIDTLALMHQKGILIVPGTDLGGAFEQHRELELFQKFGMTPAEALRRGSYDMAVYLGHETERGSIEAGKLADFFMIPGDPTENLKAIKSISMVATNGKFFFPSEVYPEFGITPFTQVPTVIEPQKL